MTPRGSRVMRPWYGSMLFELIDQPLNKQTVQAIKAEAATALRRCEPRIEVKRIRLVSIAPGQLSFVLEGIYKPNGVHFTLDGIEVK